MDKRQQSRIIGLALVRGLLDDETLKAASQEDGVILDALKSKGVLDDADIEALASIPDEPAVKVRYSGVVPPVERVPEDRADAASDSAVNVLDSFELPQWKDYLDLRFIAEGGLGRIFRAYDAKLKRTVALKFLHRQEQGLVKRFMREAQHQAMVEHPNVCKVYDAGQWQGQTFISMQFIPGETLETAATGMTLQQKVETMETVAEAIHAAHGLGLIHRDIKPANIMIETGADGGFEPFVLDFGLAKDIDVSGSTQQGMMIGTTHYMAPEQALGQVDRVDRRTDVYGLGATLYRVVTGRLVFSGVNNLDSARRTVEEEPDPPSRWVAELPKDLDAIILKCLEKDPSRRYDSARALADDLRRFLNGEPVRARRASLAYRGAKFASRHKLIVAVTAISAVLILAASAWGVAVSLRGRKAAEYAASFGAEAESMATLLRMAYLMPQHDIRPQKAMVRQRMESLRKLVQQEGRLAEGPGAFALGQGHLALREYRAAKQELERAWTLGFRNPKVSLALGRAYGELYREGLSELVQYTDLKQRENRKKELQRLYRDPALQYLKNLGQDSGNQKMFLEAFIAYCEDRFPDAVEMARQAFENDKTLYEAKMLEGTILVAYGQTKIGSDPNLYLRLIEQAGHAYGQAMEIGRSDPSLFLAEGNRCYELARYASFSLSKVDIKEFAQAEAMFDVALAVDAEDGNAYLEKSRLLNVSARRAFDSGVDPDPLFAKAVGLAKESVERGGSRVASDVQLGEIYRWMTYVATCSGKDPVPAFRSSLAYWKRALIERSGDAWVHDRLTSVCSTMGYYMMEHGQDPSGVFAIALEHSKTTMNLAPSAPTYVIGATLHTSIADWRKDRGQDPIEFYDRADEYFNKAIKLGNIDNVPYAEVADWAVRYGSFLRTTGGKTDYVINQGLTCAQKAVQIGPGYGELVNYGDILRLAAQIKVDEGKDPWELLRKSDAIYQQAAKLNSETDYYLYWYQGLLAHVEGQAEKAEGRTPEPAWNMAAKLMDRAIKMSSFAKEPVISRIRLFRDQAAWLLACEQSCQAAAKGGLALAETLMKQHPAHGEMRALHGELLFQQACSESNAVRRLHLLDQAQEEIQGALKENVFLKREFSPSLEKIRQKRAETGRQKALPA